MAAEVGGDKQVTWAGWGKQPTLGERAGDRSEVADYHGPLWGRWEAVKTCCRSFYPWRLIRPQRGREGTGTCARWHSQKLIERQEQNRGSKVLAERTDLLSPRWDVFHSATPKGATAKCSSAHVHFQLEEIVFFPHLFTRFRSHFYPLEFSMFLPSHNKWHFRT